MERLLRHMHKTHSAAPLRRVGRLTEFWNRLNLFDPFVERYVQLLRWCLAHKALVVVTVTVVFIGSLFMAPSLATEFFPNVVAGQFILKFATADGNRIEKPEAIIARI